MGVRGRAIGYRGIETRVRVYQARASAEAVEDVEDELQTQGWMPLTRELRTDGSLRVIYERLPDAALAERPEPHSVARGRAIWTDVAMTAAAVMMVLATIVVAWSALALLTSPP